MHRKHFALCLKMVGVFCLVSWCCLTGGVAGTSSTEAEDFRTVIDHRGASVRIPTKIERVVTISDGLIEGVMTAVGVEDAIVGLGSSCIPRHWEYTYPTVGGEHYSYKQGMNTVTYLNPRFMDLPLAAESGTGINYETLASLHPDVVILRIGACMLGADDEKTQKSIRMIESLGLPIVVLRGPDMFDDPHLETLSREIRIIGDIFGKEDEASKLADYLARQVQEIERRTKGVQETDKPRVLLLGLSPKARDAGGAGHVRGMGTMESYFVEELVHARNAYGGKGAWNILGAEQIMAIDPDVIILITSWGYHPPRELYEAPYYRHLSGLKAVKNRRVTALPWTPCNCQRRLEYPIDAMVIAKAAYPDRFSDVDIASWLLEFYQNVYGVDKQTARALRSAQWMDWTTEG